MRDPTRNTSAIPGRHHHPDVMETPTTEQAPPSPPADPAGATVLVVDDEPIVREIVATYLRREGYRALEAGDGVTARDLIERAQPSLVVLDVMLPGIDGLELCRWIRARSEVPVIMLTARGEEADRIVGLDLGRRRLRHQALLAPRAGRPRALGAAPLARRDRPAPDRGRPAPDRRGHPRGDARRRAACA